MDKNLLGKTLNIEFIKITICDSIKQILLLKTIIRKYWLFWGNSICNIVTKL